MGFKDTKLIHQKWKEALLGVSQRYSSILDFFEATCWIKFDELMCDHVSFLQLRYWDVHSAFAMFVLLFVLLLLLFSHIAGGGTRLLALLHYSRL